MSYRTIKRVLGETSLERKCRVLFGTCLLLLIAGAFIWVDQIAENLIKENRLHAQQALRERCRGHTEFQLLAMHFEVWVGAEERETKQQKEQQIEHIRRVVAALSQSEYEWQVLTLKASPPGKARLPATPDESAALKYLLDRIRESQTDEEIDEPETAPLAESEKTGYNRPSIEFTDGPRLFYDQNVGDRYTYYQAVTWNRTCTNYCHAGESSTMSELVGGLPPSASDKLFAVKVTLDEPLSSSTAAIDWIRAILSAAGITTFFVAMVALYVIVRYVIVKPLSHLRDVTEAISRGNTELRADIQTNDEFEELAHSFNRMLRHLTNTQSDLWQVNEDLDAKVDELAQLNMRLYEMNRLKSEFLANMSHELRTPLNSIIGFSEVLQGIDTLSDKQRKYAGNIQKSGRVLLEMINDILDLAKIDAGKMEVNPSEFQIDAIVHSQVDTVRHLADEKNIALTVQTVSGVPEVYLDQTKVQQILTNLLSNAIKFTPEGGRISVSTHRTAGGHLQLNVADSGVGIPEEDREVIFEKFRQSKSVSGKDGLTREYSGTGLGLSIVKELCKLLDGAISFKSQLGHGSTFCVDLPWAFDESTIDGELEQEANPGIRSYEPLITPPHPAS
jgi:two-component system sensor histidine kinase BarA